MARTIDQQIAEAQAKLNRLRTRQKASETRRKIIVGAIVTTEALKDPKIAQLDGGHPAPERHPRGRSEGDRRTSGRAGRQGAKRRDG